MLMRGTSEGGMGRAKRRMSESDGGTEGAGQPSFPRSLPVLSAKT